MNVTTIPNIVTITYSTLKPIHAQREGERERERERERSAIIIELTVCFETNFKKAQQKKEGKYAELVEDMEGNGFVVELITLEVGSRGFVNYDSFHRLKT